MNNKSAQPNEIKILSVVNTAEDLITIQSNTEELLKDLYITKEPKITELIDKIYYYEAAEIIKQNLISLKIELNDKEALRGYFEKLQEELMQAKTISLNISFRPSAKSIKILSEYIKENYGQNSVVEISISPEIIAGAVITHSGKYMDFSLKKKVSDLIDSKKDEIINTFKV